MENILFVTTFFTSLSCVLGNSTYYSTYYGFNLTTEQVAEYTANNTLANCTIVVEACNSTEGRRIDGTCNNLDYPSFGGSRTHFIRHLPAAYNKTSESEFDPRLSVSGNPLPLARKVRTAIFAEGRVGDGKISSLTNHLAVVYFTDVTNTRDTTNYVSWRPYCCKAEGASDSACVPNLVPEDDYVHRFSGIRCLNMTRPLTYQTSGCLPNTTTPMRIVDATPTMDLSPVYGNVVEPARRTYSGGKLVTVTVNNRTYPDTSNIDLLLGINFFGIIWYWRHHNYIATQLAEVNPTWTDDQLFEKAREINIAFAVEIFYYELMGTLMGTKNLVADGILSNCTGLRDIYNKTVLPQVSIEFTIAMRWMHSMQEGTMRMYYTNGTYISSYKAVDLTGNTNFLLENDTMTYITQGCLRQPTGKINDFVVDPDIVQRGLSKLQLSNDIMTNDLAKNRYFGLQGYIYYRNYCFGDNITCFDDLIGIIDPEMVDILRDTYEYVENLDLLAGIWAEKTKEDSYVPPTFYCIVAEQLKRTQVSDRHWHESPNRPNALTEAQYLEIKKASAARLMCNVGDDVTMIQPKALEIESPDNVMVSCDEIPAMNFSAWEDTN